MKWRAPVGLAASVAMGLAMGACAPSGFHCGANAACNGTPGETCMPEGWCAKADGMCPSGMRYTMTAGAGLANQCASADAGTTMDVGVDGSTDAPTEAQPVDTGGSPVGVTLQPPPFVMPSTLPAPPVDCNSGNPSPPFVLVGVVTNPSPLPGDCGVGGVSIVCAQLTAEMNPTDGSLYRVHVGPHGAPIPVGSCANPGAASPQMLLCPDGQVVVDIISHRDSLSVATLELRCATPIVTDVTLGNGTAGPPVSSTCSVRMPVGFSDDVCTTGLATSVAPGVSQSAGTCTPNEFGVQCSHFTLAI